MKLSTSKRLAPAIPYRARRPQFRSGDLIAQSHGSWDSWHDIKVLGVRVGTLSTYSHVGVIDVDPQDGRVYVVEAVRPVVRRVLLSTIGSFYHLNMRARWGWETDAFVRRVLDTPYSQWDAFLAYFGPLPAGTFTQCAALTREILQRANVDLGPMSRPDKVVQAALERGARLTYITNESPK